MPPNAALKRMRARHNLRLLPPNHSLLPPNDSLLPPNDGLPAANDEQCNGIQKKDRCGSV
ncbi:hypothetical protein [Alloprevotella tannerae]|uniref:hypothetical protein n=1 Tax=Alloprevotella tannerae TaxID=76122 RepID=UPI00288BA6C2|nr:hypothetical protein [Alloprevotella tannerae]